MYLGMNAIKDIIITLFWNWNIKWLNKKPEEPTEQGPTGGTVTQVKNKTQPETISARMKEREEFWKKQEQRDENVIEAIGDFTKELCEKIDATTSRLERTDNKLNTNRFDADKKPNQATPPEEKTGNNSDDLKTGNQDATSAVNKEDNNTKELEDQEIEELETEKEPLVDENSEPEIISDSPGNLMEIISDEQEILDSTITDEHEILKEEIETGKKNEGINEPLKICEVDANEKTLEIKETLATCQIEAEEKIKQIEKKKYEVTTGEAKCFNFRRLIKLATSDAPLRLIEIMVGLNENYFVVGYNVFLKKIKDNSCRDELTLLESRDSKSPLNQNSINKEKN
ncbi:chromosome partition protein Smc-like [Halyomorpha halys]|uniref:chromosome partition protein Smc-like n=1 Tax=Halyomorpha halys TaxID=286706 RepID=UPI0034D31482